MDSYYYVRYVLRKLRRQLVAFSTPSSDAEEGSLLNAVRLYWDKKILLENGKSTNTLCKFVLSKSILKRELCVHTHFIEHT